MTCPKCKGIGGHEPGSPLVALARKRGRRPCPADQLRDAIGPDVILSTFAERHVLWLARVGDFDTVEAFCEVFEQIRKQAGGAQ